MAFGFNRRSHPWQTIPGMDLNYLYGKDGDRWRHANEINVSEDTWPLRRHFARNAVASKSKREISVKYCES